MNTSIPGFYTVPQGHVAIVQRFGKHARVLQPGLHWVNPITESIKEFTDWKGKASKFDRLIETTEQLWDIGPTKCFTKDHVEVSAGVTIDFKIIETIDDESTVEITESVAQRVLRAVKRAVYGVDVFPDQLQNICTKALRSKISSYKFDEIMPRRQEISNLVKQEIGGLVKRWGVNLIAVEVGDLKFDDRITSAMQDQRIAEAEKTAAHIKAETELLTAQNNAKISEINSNSDKIANRAEIDYINALSARLGSKGAVQLLTAEKVSNAFSAIAASPNTKTIMVPSEFKGMLKLVQEKTE
jgi:regulator of protease activity HflC (stomatin/prohibitin superfamily)